MIQLAKPERRSDKRAGEVSGTCQSRFALTAGEHRERLSEASGLIVDGLSAKEAVELAGVDVSEIPEPNGASPYVPSPTSIAAGCLEVQSRWTDGEHRRRQLAMGPPRRCGIQIIDTAELGHR